MFSPSTQITEPREYPANDRQAVYYQAFFEVGINWYFIPFLSAAPLSWKVSPHIWEIVFELAHVVPFQFGPVCVVFAYYFSLFVVGLCGI